MDISWLQSTMLGFVSGLSEPLPVPAEAHRTVLARFFGTGEFSPLMLFVCHLASLAVVLLMGRLELKRLRRTARLLKTPARRRTVHCNCRAAAGLLSGRYRTEAVLTDADADPQRHHFAYSHPYAHRE